MSEWSIDYPGEPVHWFGTYPQSERERAVVGECPHACRHFGTTVVGWGPDREHYELLICDGSGECAGNCRGWCAAPSGYDQLATVDWKLLEPSRSGSKGKG